MPNYYSESAWADTEPFEPKVTKLPKSLEACALKRVNVTGLDIDAGLSAAMQKMAVNGQDDVLQAQPACATASERSE